MCETKRLSRLGCCGGCCLFFSSFVVVLLAILWAVAMAPTCGTTLSSARFSIVSHANENVRTLAGNLCPGYDWTGQTAPSTAGENPFTVSVPLHPTINTVPFQVGLPNPILGVIGYALDGIPFYGPSDADGGNALDTEGDTFNDCGGHNAPYYPFLPLPLPYPGFYHYHVTPGDQHPRAHAATRNTDFELCAPVQRWWQDNATDHSPIVGFMADGIPIYGPRGDGGVAPTDLDACNGHNDSSVPFYHYHTTSDYAFTVGCLRGCVDGVMNGAVKSPCTPAPVQYNYSSLASYTWTYGGADSGNSEDWTAPAAMFAVPGVLILGFCVWLQLFAERNSRAQTNTAVSHQQQSVEIPLQRVPSYDDEEEEDAFPPAK